MDNNFFENGTKAKYKSKKLQSKKLQSRKLKNKKPNNRGFKSKKLDYNSKSGKSKLESELDPKREKKPPDFGMLGYSNKVLVETNSEQVSELESEQEETSEQVSGLDGNRLPDLNELDKVIPMID